MLIDWFTVVAQIVNFVILVALLKHFLYRPLVRAIDAREKRITDRLSEAAEKSREADRLAQDAASQVAEIEAKRVQLLGDAQRAGDDKRRELFENARNSVRALETKWHQELDREQAAFLNEVRRRASTEILAATRHAVADLASTNIQQAAIDVFLEKLGSFDPCILRNIQGPEFAVFSATELPLQVQSRIRDSIEKLVGKPIHPSFEVSPAMQWGVELRGNGLRIGWTADTYLDSLDANLRTALERRTEEAYGIVVG